MMRATALWLTLLLALIPLGAHAACRYTYGDQPATVSFTFSSTSISIPANTPDGAILATSYQTDPLNPPTITCGQYSGNSGQWKESAETLTYGVVNSRTGYLDDETYDSGVPGISYRITHPTAHLTKYPLNSESIDHTTFSVPSSLELIKTGPIASGATLAAGLLAKWKWVDAEGNVLKPERFRLDNSITFTTPSCTLLLDSIYVTLPAVTTNAFTGVGSVSGKTPFQIQLSCPAGTAVTNITMHTTTADSHAGVVAPTGVGYAAGIGVRVLDGNSIPVIFESQTAVSPSNGTTAIPYFAQYFQTAPTVSGGNVKATVTFDIFYQ
jgi:type 1 fimbria pilin